MALKTTEVMSVRFQYSFVRVSAIVVVSQICDLYSQDDGIKLKSKASELKSKASSRPVKHDRTIATTALSQHRMLLA